MSWCRGRWGRITSDAACVKLYVYKLAQTVMYIVVYKSKTDGTVLKSMFCGNGRSKELFTGTAGLKLFDVLAKSEKN